MRFKSDEQRKAVMAKLRGRGSGTPRAPKAPKTPNPNEPLGGLTLFEILGIDDSSSSFLPNGPGQPVTPAGSFIGTGGAIYSTVASNWFLNPPDAPGFGTYNGPGIAPYVQEFSLTPQQAAWLYQQNTAIGAQLYNLFVYGVDPLGSPTTQTPHGTPGTLKPFYEATFGAYETWKNPKAPFFGGVTTPPTTGINPKFLNQKKPKKKKKKAGWLNPTGQ